MTSQSPGLHRLTCTNVVFPEPAIPSTMTHIGLLNVGVFCVQLAPSITSDLSTFITSAVFDSEVDISHAVLSAIAVFLFW